MTQAIMLAETINTKEIERKAYLSYHKDGVIDIYLGFAIIMLSFFFIEAEFNTMIGSMGGTFVLFPILYRESKKNFTFPRLGYVKFSEKKGRSRNSMLMLVGLLSLSTLLGLWTFLLGAKGNFFWIETIISQWHWFTAFLSAGLFLLFGYITDINRLYYYGFLSFILFSVVRFVPVKSFWFILTLGALMIASGLVLLQKFVRMYPLERN